MKLDSIMKCEYEYSKINRIEKPHNYMYTKYEGKEFFKKYFDCRKSCINTTNIIDDKDLLLKINNNFKKQNIKDFLKEYKSIEVIDTKQALEKIAIILNSSDKEISQLYPVLSDFCKKYEISKKIYSSYKKSPSSLKPNSDEFKELYDYCLLSFCLLSYYKISNNLKFLNCAIKINDMLCSVIDLIKNEKEIIRILTYENLTIEEKIVKDIIKQNRIGL